jgi:DNA-binding CsgD family transcriptional regulator
LYDQMYSWLGWEDHFAVHLAPPGPTNWVVVVARGTRSFTERDRILLDLARPHIAQAHRTARAFHRLERRLDQQLAARPRQSRVRIGRGSAILEYPARAQRWIHEYFEDDLPRSPGRLPETLSRWLGQWEHESWLSPEAMVRERDGRRLLCLAERGPDAGTLTLRLEECTQPSTGSRFHALGLTARETQVLLAVERGLTNHEVGAALGITVNTVKRHMEHIFDKLGVETRTAAVARLHASR